MRKRFVTAAMVGLLSSPALAGYSQGGGLTAPSQVIAKRPVTLTVGYGYDTTTPPDSFLRVSSNVSGQVQLGSGGFATFDFPVSSVAGGTGYNSASFQTSYNIPGQYSIKGSLRLVSNYFFTNNGFAGYNEVFPLSASINVIKDPVEVSRHRAAAAAAESSLNQLSLFNYLSSFGTAFAPAIGNIVGDVASNANPRLGPLISTLIGLGVGFSGGPASAAVAAAYALTTTYYQVKSATETRLANDPPDANYTEVYDPLGDVPTITSGYGLEFDTFLNNGLSNIVTTLGAERAQLFALERGQGALAAGDYVALAKQSAALSRYEQLELSSNLATAQWFEGIGAFLQVNDAGSIVDINELSAVYNTTGAQLRLDATPSVPEPSSWLMLLFGFGAMGFAMRRSVRLRSAVAFG